MFRAKNAHRTQKYIRKDLLKQPQYEEIFRRSKGCALKGGKNVQEGTFVLYKEEEKETKQRGAGGFPSSRKEGRRLNSRTMQKKESLERNQRPASVAGKAEGREEQKRGLPKSHHVGGSAVAAGSFKVEEKNRIKGGKRSTRKDKGHEAR